MATYAELETLSQNPALRSKVRVAVVISANGILQEASPTTARLAWARSVLNAPESHITQVLWSVLAQNATATSAVIAAASDAVVQTNVNNVVNSLAT